ncbi:hypothetical protein LSAT2_031861 [Lamellibrachia satsuma]|nr:hypothetical protein LSAT2_031861 [Lamellibrachia satsuma]
MFIDTDSDDSEGNQDELQDSAAVFLLCGNGSRRHKRRHRQQGYLQQVVARFRPDEFKTFFRVGRQTVDCLIGWITRTCTDEGITGITDRKSSGGSLQKPLADRVLVMLWYMASLDKYASIGDRFGMSESVACVTVHTLLKFIHDHLVRKNYCVANA